MVHMHVLTDHARPLAVMRQHQVFGIRPALFAELVCSLVLYGHLCRRLDPTRVRTGQLGVWSN